MGSKCLTVHSESHSDLNVVQSMPQLLAGVCRLLCIHVV